MGLQTAEELPFIMGSEFCPCHPKRDALQIDTLPLPTVHDQRGYRLAYLVPAVPRATRTKYQIPHTALVSSHSQVPRTY